MGSRRFFLASLTAALALTTTSAAPALAKKPDAGASGERPLTQQEQAASDRKAGEAERYVDSARSSGDDLASLACVVPLSASTAELEASSMEATEASTVDTAAIAPLACWVPQGFLAVEARDQIFGTYCGPATGQVIANYSWAMPAGANVFTQQRIAGWMSTDVNGSTGAFQMEFGLEKATAGSPRRPANWDWIVTVLSDTDHDGWVGDQLDAYVRSNISNSRMPLAIPVKPHDPLSPSGAHLASWPNPVWSMGHWVPIYGWVGIHDGTDRARMYFTDSSRDEGGATGKFWTPTRWFTLMILEHTGRFVW
ncbi:MAG: hypothetical protein ABI841_04575 [Chloroflexota bacterium]